VALNRRGRFFHYEFQINGTRYRGSTKQTTKAKAKQVEVRKMQEALENGYSPILKKPPVLRDFAPAVIKGFENSALDRDTKRYYQQGWRQLRGTALTAMKLNSITSETVDAIQLNGSPSSQNQALRTLSVILAKAVKKGYLHRKPVIKLRKEARRELMIDDDAEQLLLPVARQPLKDVLMIIRDMGMRPEESFRMRKQHIDLERRRYFNAFGKSSKSRRWIPISDRVLEALKTRVEGQHGHATKRARRKAPPTPSPWVFPSKRSEAGHITTVAKQFREARELAGLPEELKLYGARHAFGTFTAEATGNVYAVADVMGHSDLRAARTYQHPGLDPIRDAINARNNRNAKREPPQNPPQSKTMPTREDGHELETKMLMEPTIGLEPMTC
jgi:site-specific recombinase XerD